MSKIGKKPIALTTATINIEGSRIAIKGPKGEMSHDVPDTLEVVVEGKALRVNVKKKFKGFAAIWGLHRALLANKIKGVEHGFVQKVRINGLGFKAQPVDNKLVFSLGFSHKVEYVLPHGVKALVDKTGQLLEFSSIDKFALGNTCDAVRLLKLPEPYKGTGIIREGDVIIRKAGKAKAG
jgi:large subunit ribosomal protein L6